MGKIGWFLRHRCVTLLALGQSYDCPNASYVTLKTMDKYFTYPLRSDYITKTKHSTTQSCILWWDILYNQLLKSYHYNDVIVGAKASQITSLTIVYSTVYSDADERKHQSSASLAFVWGIHLWPVNSPHKWPVTRNMFPFDDVIMRFQNFTWCI